MTSNFDRTDPLAILVHIRTQARIDNLRVTQHAQKEMVEEEITLDQVREAIGSGQLLENYPDHLRGACCLINGRTANGRPLHIVCTTLHPQLYHYHSLRTKIAKMGDAN